MSEPCVCDMTAVISSKLSLMSAANSKQLRTVLRLGGWLSDPVPAGLLPPTLFNKVGIRVPSCHPKLFVNVLAPNRSSRALQINLFTQKHQPT
jgi:hypothetical protein